ncbi:MAG: lipopolysaccharide kinase InaA family protein [Phycisphaerales bacterium]|jgi:tRNA A-37 threonylcarbamoyl transferase component Bud32
MAELPFHILINRDCPEGQTEHLLCTALLRFIPGRREVYDAVWNDKSVIVKVFAHKINARRHLRREWKGLSLLQKRGLSSPLPLFYGKTEKGKWAVVVEKIADSSTVLDTLQKTKDPVKKLNLMTLACNELAKQHNKGVLQKDLHLGNFLSDGDKIFALDVGQMRFLRNEVNRKSSISKLAMLISCMPGINTETTTKICEMYLENRGWDVKKPDEIYFQKQLIVHKKRILRKWLKKILRTNKRHLKIISNRYTAVFDRSFCQQPFDFIEQIDSLMDEGHILKKGNTCYVSRLIWNGKDIVVKRYNHKGFIHSLRHTLKKSRALRGWLHGHRLGVLGIATPRPLAYIEQRKGKLVWKSYLVTEYVEGHKLHDFLHNHDISKEQHSVVIRQIKKLIDKMGKYLITHGDLKHTNILITNNGPFLTDLDGMKAHRWNWTYRIRKVKDCAHLENKEVSTLYKNF